MIEVYDDIEIKILKDFYRRIIFLIENESFQDIEKEIIEMSINSKSLLLCMGMLTITHSKKEKFIISINKLIERLEFLYIESGDTKEQTKLLLKGFGSNH